ncbi:MAG: FAD-dependent oxidoreductase [Betaproteobacteria bacterium]|nr:FAD-dependent oxidoreductase [Betaproteobacteria bacterium]
MAGLEAVEMIDCLVIGAGVVGLACARELALQGREVVIVEASADIGFGHPGDQSGDPISPQPSGVDHLFGMKLMLFAGQGTELCDCISGPGKLGLVNDGQLELPTRIRSRRERLHHTQAGKHGPMVLRLAEQGKHQTVTVDDAGAWRFQRRHA